MESCRTKIWFLFKHIFLTITKGFYVYSCSCIKIHHCFALLRSNIIMFFFYSWTVLTCHLFLYPVLQPWIFLIIYFWCQQECHWTSGKTYCPFQGSYRLWNSGKTMEFWKGNSIYGKTMEFEQNGRTYGKTMEFSFWWKKVCAFFKKIGGKYVRTLTCGFNVCCFSYHFTRPSSTNLPGYSASLARVNTC